MSFVCVLFGVVSASAGTNVKCVRVSVPLGEGDAEDA